MRALILGADGFAGRWLTRHLSESGDDVVAGVGPNFRPPLPFADEVVPVDVSERRAVDRLVELGRPEITYYLAGVSQRGKRDSLAASASVSVTGSLNVLVSLATNAPASKLLFVSSGFVYPSSAAAQDEGAVTAPGDTYGATKLAAEDALRRLSAAAGVELLIARPFNHIGPGQAAGFLVPTIASQLRLVAEGRASQISVGSVTDVRDFTDVRDVVRAYRLIGAAGSAGSVYNVASGEGILVGDIIDRLIRLAGVEASVASKAPPNDKGPSSLIGDPSRLVALGWSREFSLEDSLRDALAEHLPGRHAAAANNPLGD
jgi:GDP-4-dehydro-6-deoxy-D-mannose reductase